MLENPDLKIPPSSSLVMWRLSYSLFPGEFGHEQAPLLFFTNLGAVKEQVLWGKLKFLVGRRR